MEPFITGTFFLENAVHESHMKMSANNNFKIGTFLKNASETLEKMKNAKEISDVTLISEDYIMFQAYRVVLASTSPFFRQMLNINNNSSLQLRGVNSNFLASLLEVVYDEETEINTEYCHSFIRMLKYYQVYEKDIGEAKTMSRSNENKKYSKKCNF